MTQYNEAQQKDAKFSLKQLYSNNHLQRLKILGFKEIKPFFWFDYTNSTLNWI